MAKEGWEPVVEMLNKHKTPSAILPQTLSLVNRLANEGKTAGKIGWKIALAEFFEGTSFPREFIKSHEERTGAKMVVVTGAKAGLATLIGATFAALIAATMLGPALTLGIIWGMVLGEVLTALGVGSLAHLRAQAILDCHYVKESGLLEKIKEVGAAEIDKNGELHTNIIFMNEMPKNPDEWELKPTGMLIKGEPIWASTKYGKLILFGKGASSELVEMVNGKVIRKEGSGVKPSEKIINKLKWFFKKVNVEPFNSFKKGISIDWNAEGKTITYDNYGEMVVSGDNFEGVDMKKPEEVASRISDLMAIRTEDKNMLVKNMYFKLDTVKDVKSFEEILKAATSFGNSQWIVDPEVFKELKPWKIQRITKLAKKCGVEMFVDLSKGEAGKEKTQEELYKVLGFPGYAVPLEDGKKMKIYDYRLPESEAVTADVITEYKSPEGLIEKVRDSKEESQVFLISDIIGLMTSERVDVGEYLGMFGQQMLGVFNVSRLTAKKISEAGNDWDREKLPTYTRSCSSLEELYSRLGGLVELLKSGDTEKLLEIGIGEESVRMYVKRIEKEMPKDQAEQLKTAFLTRIVKKILVKAKLDYTAETIKDEARKEALKKDGLEGPIEIMLGDEMMKQIEKKWAAKELDIEYLRSLVQREGIVTEEDFTKELYRVVNKLIGTGKPEDVNAAIELMAQLGPVKENVTIEQVHELFNAQAIESVLEAA